MNAGIAGVVVDAKDGEAADYYQKLDLKPSPDNPLQLFLPIATLQAAIIQAAPKQGASDFPVYDMLLLYHAISMSWRIR